MTFPDLTVIAVGPTPRHGRPAAAWTAFLQAAGLTSEWIDGPATLNVDVNAAVRRSRGEFVLLIDAAAAPADWFARLWADRRAAGFVVLGSHLHADGRTGSAASHRALKRRVLRRVLSLPVSPLASAVFARRAALAQLSGAPDAFEWLVEVIVLATSDGWPVRQAAGPAGDLTPAPRLAAGALWRLWVLRNSAFSADYDERAYNSLIPLQRYWQRTRHRLIHGFVDPTTRILDVGCGSSRIVQDLPHSVGLDVQIKKLRRIAPRTRKVVQATLTQLPFPAGAFETLICSQVIEHVPAPLVDWREMNRVLTAGGTLVVGTPDYETLAWPVLERLYGIVHPKGYVHEHINQYTAASLRHALDTHGFEVLASAYVGGGELIIKARKIAASA